MAPFTPFLTEHMYQNLKNFIVDDSLTEEQKRSVHFLMLPKPKESLIFKDVEEAVSRMQSVIELGRVARDRKTLPLKYPLPELVVVHSDTGFMKDVRSMEKYILEELNVKKVSCTSDREKFGLRLKADLNFQLGKKLKQDFKKVLQASKELSEERLQAFVSSGSTEICGHLITAEDMKVNYAFGEDTDLSSIYEPNSDNEVVILLNITPDQSMLDEGIAREIINRIQKLRKKAKLVPTDEVTIAYEVKSSGDKKACDEVTRVAKSHAQFIFDGVRQPVVPADASTRGRSILLEEEVECKGALLKLQIHSGHTNSTEKASIVPPSCQYVNLVMDGQKASVLLENPVGQFMLSSDQLLHEAQIIYNLQGRNLKLSSSPDMKTDLSKDLTQYHGKLLYVGLKK
jgi:isoleucyl-tRNA synthetase